jgi:hypothetical protein
MAASAIEVHDMARLRPLLVMPSASRRPITPAELAVFNARLAPIEMAAPSLHLMPRECALLLSPTAKQSPPLSSLEPPAGELPQYALPGVYGACGLALCLSNLLVPDGVAACVQLLGPVWTLALALQALADPDPAWRWLGGLAGLLLPFVVLLRDPLFVCFYLGVFAAFASGRFWDALHGPAFVLVCACWFGLLSACALSVLANHPRAQLAVATFFALAAAIVSSGARFGKLRLSVLLA